ncbi:MAG: right-handed parallel beta-helix repeat-containing protein [Isosphaeraceae bacterium]
MSRRHPSPRVKSRRRPTDLRPALEAVEPRVVPTDLMVTNMLDHGPGSLREAIISSNALPTHDSISFNLTGVTDAVIRLDTELPALTDGVTIVNPGVYTLAKTHVGITLARQSASPSGIGFAVRANNCEIAGFAIYGLSHGVSLDRSSDAYIHDNYIGLASDGVTTQPGTMYHAVRIGGSSYNTIVGNVLAGCERQAVWSDSPDAAYNTFRGNRIGTNAAGTAAAGNQSAGIELAVGTHHCTIEENLISGNRTTGLAISNAYGVSAHDNVVRANVIGLDAYGAPLGNGSEGLYIGNSYGNVIGGPAPNDRNIISGNGAPFGSCGVRVEGSLSSGNIIRHNLIGLDVQGRAVGNAAHGLALWNGCHDNTVIQNVISGNLRNGVDLALASNNTIGAGFGEGNIIERNAYSGVAVRVGGVGNTIRANSIAGNGRIGIDLGGDGVTPNDPGDLDAGPNTLLNFPTLTGARPVIRGTRVNGRYSGAPASTFFLDFYASAAAGPGGYGDGATLLGSTTVTTDDSGQAIFDVTLPIVQLSGDYSGQFLCATATDAGGNTSEFAKAVPIRQPLTVTAVTVNSGDAQRSKVTSVSVVFSGVIDVAAVSPAAFQIARAGGGALTPSVSWNTVGGSSVAVLSFSGPLVEYGSLVDGRYTLSINGLQLSDTAGVPVDADADGAAGGVKTFAFHRLFGDADGDGDVDNSDALRFRLAYLSPQPAPAALAVFDFNGDGRIDALDLAAFNLRRGLPLP